MWAVGNGRRVNEIDLTATLMIERADSFFSGLVDVEADLGVGVGADADAGVAFMVPDSQMTVHSRTGGSGRQSETTITRIIGNGRAWGFSCL